MEFDQSAQEIKMDRRTFLKLLIGGMSIPLLEANGEDGKEAAQRKQDENNVVILSDVHVGVRSGQWQRDHLAGRVSTILSMKPLPCCVLILGDLAYDHGDVGDYTLFKRMMEPLDKAGVPWHRNDVKPPQP